MKNLLTIWLILLCAYAGRAQNWQPFVPGMKYFYKIENVRNTSELEFFHIDSVYPAGTDTVYLNNARHFQNDTCAKRFTNTFPFQIGAIWAPDKVIKTPQYWKFNYSYNSWDTAHTRFYLPLQIALNDTWQVTDTGQNPIPALCTCISIEKSAFLSLTDSVKNIRCIKGNDSLWFSLSKHYGLLQFPLPYKNVVKGELAGFSFNGSGAGIQPLSLRDAFLPKPGDILYFREIHLDMLLHEVLFADHKDSITNVQKTTDSLIVSLIRMNYYYSDTASNNTLAIRGSIHINQFDNEFYSPKFSITQLYDTASRFKGSALEFSSNSKDLVFNEPYVRFLINEGTYFDRTICTSGLITDAGIAIKRSITLGDIYTFDANITTYLAGYRLGTESKGQLNLSLAENTYSAFHLFPNPASEKLYINLHQQFHYGITNLSGKTISEGHAKNEIDISTLAPGLYFIEINGTYQKFIKQ